jgi:hypothetical protein
VIVSPHVATGAPPLGAATGSWFRARRLGKNHWRTRDPRSVLRALDRAFPLKGSRMWGIYGGIAFAGLLALVFSRASRRHP